MGDTSVATQVATKWRKKRGSLIMALHEIQDIKGYVPWEDALEVAQAMNIPLARIYEVLTFYNFFKLEAPGKAVISVCTGTACYLKGNDKVLEEFKKELGIGEGESTPDPHFPPAMRPLRRLLRPGPGLRGQRQNLRPRNRRRRSQHHRRMAQKI